MARKARFIPRVRQVRIEEVNDTRRAEELMKLVLLAIEIADKPQEEASEIQRRFFDNP